MDKTETGLIFTAEWVACKRAIETHSTSKAGKAILEDTYADRFVSEEGETSDIRAAHNSDSR